MFQSRKEFEFWVFDVFFVMFAKITSRCAKAAGLVCALTGAALSGVVFGALLHLASSLSACLFPFSNIF